MHFKDTKIIENRINIVKTSTKFCKCLILNIYRSGVWQANSKMFTVSSNFTAKDN